MLTPGLDSITVLKSVRGRASKRIVAAPEGTPVVIGYDAGWQFYAFVESVSSIIELSSKLSAVETLPNCFVIRGAPRGDLDQLRPQRRLKTNFQTPPTGRRWVLIDVDKMALPPGLSLNQDVGAVCEHLVGLLPAEFHTASYHWQLSSRAGIGDPSVVSLHLWFWLDRPVTDGQLKSWSSWWNAATKRELIDSRLFNDVQAHYTAAPSFEGMSDPFPARSGLVRKAVDEVALKLPPPERRVQARAGVESPRPSGGFENFLSQIGDHQGGEGFHEPLIRAVASYAATHGREGTDIEELYELVRARVLAADRSNHADDYVERMASREQLIPDIERALAKFAKPDAARRKSRQTPGVPAHFSSQPIPAPEASALLNQTIRRFMRPGV